MTDQINKFQLSSNGLSQVSQVDFEKDFTFIVGSNYYECNKYAACFISSKVARMVKLDSAADTIEVDVDDDGNQFGKYIIPLMEGKSLDYDEEAQKYLMEISPELGNVEMMKKTLENLTEVTSDDVSERILFFLTNKLDITKEIEFLASHFSEVPMNDKKKLGCDILSDALAHPSLSIFSEDALLDEILSLGEDFNELLSYVEFQYLSDQMISQFLDNVDHKNISRSLWSGLCRRLKFPLNSTIKRNDLRHIGVFEANQIEGKPFEGIISNLTKQYGGNVHLKGAVKISSSSNGFNTVHQVADYGWDSYWATEYQSSAFLQFDFKKLRVQMNGYTLKTGEWEGVHLEHWVMEGSHDGEKWREFDEQNTEELNGNFVVKSFKCSSSEAYRYIRLRQVNESTCDCLELCNIELFGKIYRNE